MQRARCQGSLDSIHCRQALALAISGLRVTAFDAAPEGLAAMAGKDPDIATPEGERNARRFEDGDIGHVLGWNLIGHGDETVLLNSIGHVRRIRDRQA